MCCSAEKFGVEYVDPSQRHDMRLDARKERFNRPGFATGIVSCSCSAPGGCLLVRCTPCCSLSRHRSCWPCQCHFLGINGPVHSVPCATGLVHRRGAAQAGAAGSALWHARRQRAGVEAAAGGRWMWQQVVVASGWEEWQQVVVATSCSGVRVCMHWRHRGLPACGACTLRHAAPRFTSKACRLRRMRREAGPVWEAQPAAGLSNLCSVVFPRAAGF